VNVLLLAHSLRVGGTEVLVAQMARWLRKQGVSASIGCLDDGGELVDGLVEEGYAVEVYGRRPGLDLSLPLKIARSVRRQSIDVIHAHQHTCFVYGALSKLRTRRPLIFTEHGRFHPDRPSARRRAFNALFARFCDRVTAVSGRVKRSLAEIEGFDPAAIEVIHNGIDPARFTSTREDARRLLGVPAAASVVGTVGRLNPIKNQALLIRAFQRVLQEAPDALLLIVGDGEEGARLRGLAAELRLDGSVRFLGARDDVERILPAFDVFALSSLSEGMPVTLLEAMAASVAIVSTAVGGIPEILRDGEEAILVPAREAAAGGGGPSEDDAATFAAGLARALKEPGVARRLAASAHERLLREFTLDVVWGKYLQIYRDLAGVSSR
jgi:glycosyltransferase involved in cell wall biosynthesis